MKYFYLKLRYFFILTSLILCACASSPLPPKDTAFVDTKLKEIEASRQVRAMNERIIMTSMAPIISARDYKIGPEDLLEISVFEEEKLHKTVRVSSQGHISFPLLGTLYVKGLTASELEREIRDLLAEKYLRDPHVSVFIKEYRSQRISVLGLVEKPGMYEVTGPKTILDMLAMAGGLKEDAGQLLFLIRPPALEESSAGENKKSGADHPQTLVIDLDELLLKGEASLNLPVVSGDIINVPASGKVFVGGEVIRPGGFPLKGKKLTLSQAIVLAEGIKPEGNGAETKIYRFTGKGNEKKVISVNLYAVQNGEAPDIFLQENDVVFVPKSGVKNFLYGVRDTFRGIFGFGIGFSRSF